ncbi:MAG: ABC transporter substrate-binding protein [Firmicutes bacterium]|nr:ABC transporter substrate-binding protein [Bacillota bacterium]
MSIESVAIVSEDTEFGAQIANLEEAKAKELGYKVVEKITYPRDSTNVTAEVLRLKKANPDVVLQASYTSDAILFMKTYKDLDFTPKAIIGQRAGFIAPEFFTALGKMTDYVYTTTVWAPDLGVKRPMVKVVNEMYKKKTGKDLTGDYARAFTGLLVLADALNRAGSTKPGDIKKALLETSIGGDALIVPWSGVKFDQKTHQNTLATGIIAQAFDGTYVTVWPTDVAAKEFAWPMPAWKDRK